jgi:3-hydroxyisobutyrate dehydrogenase-like beta-hydroxyacid dehydrogenase
MIKRTFAPGFRIALHQKDLNLALPAPRRWAWRCRRRRARRS